MAEEAASAIVILVAALAALVWANSRFFESYFELWGTGLTIELGDLVHLELTLQEWVNDGLMTVFFFLVALEVKREVMFGELRDPRKAVTPIIAALGGMVLPALVYLAFNAGGPGERGWGIPVATDIAFAVGIVVLAGSRVPPSGKVFLLTLAIADDIGGIIVIALFYAGGVSVGWLAVAGAVLAVIAACRAVEIRSILVYGVLAVACWYAFLESGVHATISGVAVGLLMPTRSFLEPATFRAVADPLVERIQRTFDDRHVSAVEEVNNAEAITELVRVSRESISPLDRAAHALEPWVAFAIVPTFALANAGVRVIGSGGDLEPAVIWGAALGLVLGKPIGVLLATFGVVKLGIGRLPTGASWSIIGALGIVAGVGFTVALFITGLSFDSSRLEDSAKLGVLVGSLVAGSLGYVALRVTGRAARS